VTGNGAPATDVAVIGGGAIGLSIAWRVATTGLAVTVCDPDPGRGASWAAAGMLAPVSEVHYGEEALLALNLDSARRWPSFAAALEAASDTEVGLRTEGTLIVAHDDDDLRSIDELARFQLELGLAVERLRARDCRALEPLLHPRVRGGLLVSDDHQVDNRRLVAALLTAAERAGVTIRREPVVEMDIRDERVTAVRLQDGDRLTAGAVVLAAGCWSSTFRLPPAAVPPVRPVKGQIVRLRSDPGWLGRPVRGLAHGSSVYLVPRAGGEVVVGATVEELGFDTRVTAGAAYELLRAAVDVVPGVAELELVETTAGLRPGTPDNAPVLGPTPVDGLILATGHFRNGILLTPVTADSICALVADGVLPAVAQPFTIDRFRA
jgi:glycine oxidase